MAIASAVVAAAAVVVAAFSSYSSFLRILFLLLFCAISVQYNSHFTFSLSFSLSTSFTYSVFLCFLRFIFPQYSFFASFFTFVRVYVSFRYVPFMCIRKITEPAWWRNEIESSSPVCSNNGGSDGCDGYIALKQFWLQAYGKRLEIIQSVNQKF